MTTIAPAVRATATRTWLPLAAFNTVARRIPRLQVSLDVAELQAAARHATGLTDLGGDEYVAGLHEFVAALEREAMLTPAGRWFARGQIVASLTNRLLLHQQIAAEPAVVARPVGPAVVVLGLPRSGTTLLQHLLALDPANRFLRQWEAACPAPPPEPGGAEHDPRVRAAERAVWLVDRIAPAARALHPTGPRLPTECVTLFANSFASLELSSIYQVPSYTRWCLATDMRPHYAYYTRQLQLLGWLEHGERWMLKSPAHLFWVPELTAALPEAQLVVLHRDPAEVIGSFCSLVAVMAATNSKRVDHAGIGAFWSRTWLDGVARLERARIRGTRLHDVRYTDLLADPVAVVEGIYDAFGYRFTPSFADAISRHVGAHPQHARGRHTYDGATFGLDLAAERDRFARVGGDRWR